VSDRGVSMARRKLPRSIYNGGMVTAEAIASDSWEVAVTADAAPSGLGRAPTMSDVAERAGVSRALVSTVFRGVPGASPATRERVLQAAADLGYRLDNRARMLRRSRTQLLGVVYIVPDAFHAQLVEAIYPPAEAAGYTVLLSAVTAHRDEQRAVNALLDDRCEALLLCGPQVPDSRLAALGARTPTIVLTRRTRAPSVDVVRTDDKDVVALALGHLHSHGHRSVAHLDGGKYRGAADRRRAYEQHMRRLGLAAHIRVIPGGITEDDGTRAATQLLRHQPLPTALIAYNDRSAIGAILELRRAGIDVPGQISVIGYDDVPMAALPYIDLTTVGQDATDTAKRAVDIAITRLADNDSPRHDTLIAPYLVTRGTTAMSPTSAQRDERPRPVQKRPTAKDDGLTD
jgi:DNA-binding LacI/PurR family transcriptional regulator